MDSLKNNFLYENHIELGIEGDPRFQNIRHRDGLLRQSDGLGVDARILFDRDLRFFMILDGAVVTGSVHIFEDRFQLAGRKRISAAAARIESFRRIEGGSLTHNLYPQMERDLQLEIDGINPDSDTNKRIFRIKVQIEKMAEDALNG